VNILQVTPYFAPAWAYGGPPRVMYDYAVGLARRGHTVTVLTTDVLDGTHRAVPAEEVLEGIHVRRYRNISNTLAWRTKKYLPPGLLSPRLTDVVASNDIVHVTDARTLPTAAAYLAARARGVPLCVSVHGSLPGSSGLRGVVKGVYDAALVRPMLARAGLLLAQTAHEAELYEEFGASRDVIELLPLPIDLAELADNVGRGDFRARLGVNADVRILLFLGRINPLKGLDVLIDSVEPLLDAQTVLAVVGRDDGHWGLLSSRFQALLRDGRLRFVGPIYGRERFAAYVDADVFCLTPRHWEETSVAALEAAACGTPLVLTEQTDVPGLAASGGGLVVKLEVAAIRAAVAEVLANRVAMGESARLHVRNQHASDAVVARLESYFVEAVLAARVSA
jgi:glycosyltransferase involved in cell wall biosynthesis